MAKGERSPGSLTHCRVLQLMHHQRVSFFLAQFLYAVADVRRPFPGSRSSLNTSELKGSSVISVVQQQPLYQQALISFLSATAIMSQQQSNTKQLLRKPKKSEIRQMGLRCSWFLTFCSSSSVFIHADVELLAELFFFIAHVSEKELCYTCFHSPCSFKNCMFYRTL